MVPQEVEGRAIVPPRRDLRGVVAAFVTALGMWFFILVGLAGLILKILH